MSGLSSLIQQKSSPILGVSTAATHRMQELHSPKHNHLLASLPVNVYLRLLSDMELVKMTVGDVVQDADCAIDWIYFPTTSVVSTGYITENGSSPAVALTGHDGFVGTAYVMGSSHSSTRAVVQSAGVGYRIRASLIKKELQRNGDLLNVLMLYIQSFLTQVSQTAVCNRLHTVDQQLCRWLLMSADRLASQEIYLTHELIANMLGVRREGVTQAAGKLQNKGFIQYSRGRIFILDREAIERSACECYGVAKKEYQRLLPRKAHSDIPLSNTQKLVVRHSSLTSIQSCYEDKAKTLNAFVGKTLTSGGVNGKDERRQYAGT